ncbi:ABC transporter permease [Vulcanimicrobium alpinum]|uniref:ABC transporter permease n=1 Tax=Vulcanimicrobium alpinum TaxID=3016050 RepID=A0AAN1XWH0_UNVUL|nr:ABC transporter permease subunit [Vulcanimicrobium alpinum]BDE05557.1 ABC transporter permease [Vulcanimicrobium alpinum]
MTIVLFAGLTLRELARRKLVAAVALLTAIIVAFTAWGLHKLATTVVDGAPLGTPAVHAATAGIVILLAFLFSFVLALGAALIGAPALAEGVANGEILALLARPIRRADVVLGRWLGTLAALALYVALAGGAELGVARAITGYVPPQPLVALAYLIALSAVVSSAAIALAARLPALAAGIVAALCFGLAWIGGIVEAIGLALANRPLADAGTIVALLFPSDALWRGALYALQPAVFTAAAGTASATTANPFAVTAPPPIALVTWAAGWIVVVTAAALLLFRTRDL